MYTVCEYYVHGECVDFAAADCKENATYCAGSEPRHVHHWREGNLPANSKCAACRRACWSTECLTGYRCEWCGSTVSDTFFTKLLVDWGILYYRRWHLKLPIKRIKISS